MLERITFELRKNVSETFLDVCALKGLDPDRLVEKLMAEWLCEEKKRMAEKKKSRRLAKVLRFTPRKRV